MALDVDKEDKPGLYKSKSTIDDFRKAEVMICSNCGHIIAKKHEKNTCFDVFDCSWECKNCGELWLSSDNWIRIGKVLLAER